MSENTTRISDLPENITLQPAYNTGNDSELKNTYIPMNIHPNPYGNNNGPQPNMIPPPIQQPPKNVINANPYQPQLSPEEQNVLQNMPPQRLPHRNVQMDTASYYHDEEIQPNYIPKPKLNSNYLQEYESENENIRKHEHAKNRTRMVDTLFTELQTPILIGLLYFIFQMPFINNSIFKYFTFLKIYNEDGNINFNGMFLKSILFGLFFYSVMKLSNYISEI
jgi:hypothetical protein